MRVNERAKVSGCGGGLGGFTIKMLLLPPWSWWVIFPFLALPSFVLRAPELKFRASHMLGMSLGALPILFSPFTYF